MIYCQKWYVHESEDNYGLVQHCQQLMESYVQMIKRELRVKGNAQHGWMRRVWEFADLYCVAAMGYDEINFYNIFHKSHETYKLIYDEESTQLVEEQLEYEMPDKFWELLLIIDNIECGDAIPDEITRIMDFGNDDDDDGDGRLYHDIGRNHRRYADFYLADDIHDEVNDPNLLYPDAPHYARPHRNGRRYSRIEEMRRQRRLLRQHRQRNPLAAGVSDDDNE